MKQTSKTAIRLIGLLFLAAVTGTLLNAKGLSHSPSFIEASWSRMNFEKQHVWPNSASELMKKITLNDPDMHFKKGKDVNKLSSHFANKKGKSSVLIYCNGDQVKSVQYMVVLDVEDGVLSNRLKEVRKFMLSIWGTQRADWIDGEVSKVEKNVGHSVKNRMPDTDIKLEFEYLAPHKVANIIFNQIVIQ
ncbi:hypothetical protein [Pedobacter nutrimenti]|uniref:hypothetical protein n=1 Tax=Pedobacter nutrimenti TaxID=1241337 RepID=UPI00292F794B|nr:hypothetical protein [Pedobacter nutrimenti]